MTSISNAIPTLLSTISNNNNNYNNNINDRYRDHNRGNNNNNRHNSQDNQKASAALFLIVVISIFLLCIFYHLFDIYIVRRKPYYYSVQSEVDPTIWHVERVIPIRERLRQWQGRPRSDSDVFRDEDLERVRRELLTRGWRGRVNSDGTPNKNHRLVDDRAAVGFGAGGSAAWGYSREICDEEYGPRQYVETEDTPFWKERMWGTTTYSGLGKSPRKNYGSFGSPGKGNGNLIPGALARSQFPTGIVTPDFGSGDFGKGADKLNAAFSYHASPMNTNFITPPIRASSKILEGLNHTGLRFTTDRSARFPDEDLQDHYAGLCESEDAALKDLEDARNAAAVEHTYNPSAKEPNHAQRVIEKLTELERKLLHAMKRRSLFAERFAMRDDMIREERGESSRGPSVSEPPPPPYTDIDETGLQFDEDTEPGSSRC